MSADFIGLIVASFAGIFTLFSPCSYPLLPGYILYHLGSEISMRRAFTGGVLCAVGFILIFAVVGVAAWTLRNLLLPIISVFELAAAFLVIFMGLQILMRSNFLSFHLQATVPQPKSFAGLFLFGVAYGLAAVGCSAPIFFSILLYAISTGGFLNATVTFLVYALTMGVTLIGISALTAKAQSVALKKMAAAMPWLRKISGIFLLIVGFYLFYFYYTVYYVK